MANPYYLLFDIAAIAWIVSELIGARIIPIIRARGSSRSARADSGSLPIIGLCLVIAIVVIVVFRNLGLATFPLWIEYLGLLLVFVGIAIRQWAIAVLGKFFNVVVRTLKDHRVVDNGPYKYVRHPSYTGLIISIIGIGLVGGSWEGLLAVIVAIAISLWYRIKVEERFLLKQLGPSYTEYRKHTKYLIPFLL